MTSPILA